MLIESAPSIFFLPPYVGHKGWVGIELNKGLAWNRVAELTLDTYRRVARPALAKQALPIPISPIPDIMTIEQINPLRKKNNLNLLKKLRKICLALTETTRDSQFGNPCLRAGKKICSLYWDNEKTTLQLWVGGDRLVALISFDERFRIPPYAGHNGWIDLSLSNKQNWQEISALLLISYTHFALKRMLKVLTD